MKLKITKKKLLIGIISLVLFLVVLLIVLRLTVLQGGSPPNFPGGGMGKNPSEGELNESSATPVTVVEVTIGDIQSTLFYTGELHAEDEVEVYAVASGKVMKYNFNEGDTIRKGEILVRLERQEIWDEYMPLNVRAPISGIVARNYLDVGELATTTTPLALIMGGDTIKAIVKVADVEIGRIKVGMEARLTISAIPGVIFPGQVYEVSPFLDSNTHTARVELSFEKADPSFTSGMFGDIIIITEEKENETCIPASALLYEKSGRKDPYCFVIENNTAHKRSLTLGIINEDIAEVIEGVEPGAEVAVSGKDTLKDGSTVRIVEKP